MSQSDNPPVEPHSTLSHRAILSVAAPMVISNISTPILGLVDTAVLGHLGDASYLGAVATGGLLFSFLYWSFGFLRMSTTGVAAQASGKHDYAELRALLLRSIILALLFAGLLLLLKTPLARIGFEFIGASRAVEDKAAIYYFIRIWSAPFTFVNYVLMGWFIGAGTSKIPLLMMLSINLCNIALDLLFVVHFDWGVQGVAYATLLAEMLGVVLGLLMLPSILRKHPGHLLLKQVFNLQKFRQLALLNADIFIRTLCLIFAFAWFTRQGAKQGDAVLAANSVLFNFYTLMAYAQDGIANAAELYVGRAIGRARASLFWRAIYLCTIWSAMIALLFTLLFSLLGVEMIALLTDLHAVRWQAQQYLIWIALLPLISFWSFLLDGVFIGATWSAAMRNCMLFSTCGVFLPSWYWLQGQGNQGLWIAFLLFMTARAVSQMLVLYWRHRQGQIMHVNKLQN